MYAVLKRSNRLVFCLFLFGSVLVSATYFLWNVERIGRAQASGISTEAKPEVSEKRFPETLPFDWRRSQWTSGEPPLLAVGTAYHDNDADEEFLTYEEKQDKGAPASFAE